MRTIKASEFKAKCLQLIDEVAASGEPIEITKRGKAMVHLVISPEKPFEDNLTRFKRLFPAASRHDGDSGINPEFSIWSEHGGFDDHMERKFGYLWKDKEDAS
jgi:prevent-host-death family protein